MSNQQTTLPLVAPGEILVYKPVSPVAANADPHTSHVAARRVTRDGTRKRQSAAVLAALLEWQEHWDGSGNPVGCTSLELSVLSGLERHLVAKRLPELADAKNGALVERGEARRCSISDHMALTWWARAEGGQ